LSHITSTGWTIPDAPDRSFDLRTICAASLVGAVPFVAFDIVLIATGILTLQIIGTFFLGLTMYVLFARKAVAQEVRLERDVLVLRRGIGPPTRVSFGDVISVEEQQLRNTGL